MKNLKQIYGGCYCYCSFRPANREPYLFIGEVSNGQECDRLCRSNINLPYFNYSFCLEYAYYRDLKRFLLNDWLLS